MTCSIFDFYLVSSHFIHSRSNQLNTFGVSIHLRPNAGYIRKFCERSHESKEKKNPDVNQQHTKCWKQWKQKTITNAYFITARCLVYSLACEAIHRFSLLGLLYSFRFNAYKYIFCLFHFKKNIVCFFAHFMTSFECYNQSSHLIWAAHLGNFFLNI